MPDHYDEAPDSAIKGIEPEAAPDSAEAALSKALGKDGGDCSAIIAKLREDGWTISREGGGDEELPEMEDSMDMMGAARIAMKKHEDEL